MIIKSLKLLFFNVPNSMTTKTSEYRKVKKSNNESQTARKLAA